MAGKRANGEGTIGGPRDSDGLYFAALVVDGKRRWFYGKTRAEVARKLTDATHARDRGLPLPGARLTTGEHLESWLAEHDCRPRTKMSYGRHIQIDILPVLGKVPLEKLTPAHVRTLQAGLLARGLAPATVMKVRAVLGVALNQAMRDGLILRNVVTLTDAPKVQRFRPRILQQAEAEAFLTAAAGHRFGALFITALGTGARQGELLALRWSDVDFDRKLLTIERQFQRVGKTVHVLPPKSEAGRRVVSLPAFVIAALRENRAAQNRMRLLSGSRWHDEGLLFTSQDGKPLDASNVRNYFKRFLADNGLPDIRFHDLRHTVGSNLHDAGIPARTLQAQMGHADVKTTLGIYAHTMNGALERAADVLEKRLGGNGA